MEANQQTSFIPKKPLVNGGGNVHTTNFFSIIATVIFVTVLVLSGIVFAYQYYLNSSIVKTKADLQTELNNFNPTLIAQLSRLDNRIDSAKSLLAQHVAISGFFSFLSNETLQNVRFTNFTYAANVPGQATLSMTGQATSFAAVALESSQLNSAQNLQYFQNPSFSNLNLDNQGNVTFSLSGTINTNAFLYTSEIQAGLAGASSTIPVTASSSPQNQ